MWRYLPVPGDQTNAHAAQNTLTDYIFLHLASTEIPTASVQGNGNWMSKDFSVAFSQTISRKPDEAKSIFYPVLQCDRLCCRIVRVRRRAGASPATGTGCRSHARGTRARVSLGQGTLSLGRRSLGLDARPLGSKLMVGRS